MKTFRILLGTAALAAILSLPFIIRPYRVQGSSMYPVLQNGELIAVDTLSLGFIAPRRDELIVFYNPHKKNTTSEIDVKRVIGLPGEHVSVLADKVVVRSAAATSSIELGDGSNGLTFEMQLGPEDYFVLGDNRRDSSDSRLFGAVQPGDFIGRVILSI
ncbi:MAG TPA: signal peptidase I [Candidatus Paceibacterota bacterium]|jgi:signal peptidase I|nr:signal peptidase I [Candidatus Paceibacterota bacterium]